MSVYGGEGLDDVHERLSQLSDRQAANARHLVEAIERHRQAALEQGQSFFAPSAEQLLEKLQRSRTPLLFAWSWTTRTFAPGTIKLAAGVFNPDPVDAYFVFVHAFVGLANLSADPVQALTLTDERFPKLTEPPLPGLILAPSAEATVQFAITVPIKIEPSNYLGNVLLFRAELFGNPGEVLDRGVFVFGVRPPAAL